MTPHRHFAAALAFATCAPVANPAPQPPLFVHSDAEATEPADGSEPVSAGPFSLEQLRNANPEGTILLYRHEQKDQPPVVVEMTFISTNEDGAKLQEVMRSDYGTVLRERESEITWDRLVPDAALSAEAGDITDMNLEVVGLPSTCRLYTVRDDDGVSRYCFDLEQPGPPVLFEKESDGQILLRVTLMERRPPE